MEEVLNMSSDNRIRNPDEWYEDKHIIHEEELEEGNKIRVFEDEHCDADTGDRFWHGIQI